MLNSNMAYLIEPLPKHHSINGKTVLHILVQKPIQGYGPYMINDRINYKAQRRKRHVSVRGIELKLL